MGRRLEYEVKTSVRLNMSNPQHVKINDVIQNLDPKIFKSKNQFIIDAIQFYIDNYGKETFVIKKKEKERAEYIRSEDIDDIKEEVIEAATNEARKEVIKLLGGVISGMNVGQPVIMQAANSEAQEPTEDVMDDADVALKEKGEGRTKMAHEQVAMPPVPMDMVFNYINEFLNQLVDKPISLSKLGSIALDGKDEDIIGHGIWVKDTFNWKPQSSKPPYLSSDKKYTIIQEQFNLGFQKDLVWLKFTEDGYVGVVADSSDINHSYTNTAGRLLREVNRTWDTSNLFIFPITSAMTKHKTRKQIENGIGKYLIYKGVPIIDFYSHNNF